MAHDRAAFDEAIANMSMQTSPYYKEYVFYMHLLAQCRVVFSDKLQAAAGVTFKNDHYQLHLNPTEIISEIEDENGKPVVVQGFSSAMPVQERIGILKHEMLHIALGHLLRVKDGDKNFTAYNFASDCALNQEITRDHLPDYAIYPDNFPVEEEDILWGESAEYYYSLIPIQEMGEGGKSMEGQGPLDDHELWKETEGDPTLQQELTKNMVEKAGQEAIKSAGTLPSSYSDMIDNLTKRREVDWKRVLRSIVGNKKANSRKTLMRRDRRLPFANWIKGKTKDRIFELGVVSDVSGSVSDESLYALWGEIVSICDMFDTPVKMIQVDTEAQVPENLTKNTKVVERKACGGTILAPAIDMFKRHNIKFDALVITTDGYLFDEDIQPFYQLRKPVIWLIEPGGNVMPEMNQGAMRAIQLT
jgi:predicted metal-dependent peptidase